METFTKSLGPLISEPMQNSTQQSVSLPQRIETYPSQNKRRQSHNKQITLIKFDDEDNNGDEIQSYFNKKAFLTYNEAGLNNEKSMTEQQEKATNRTFIKKRKKTISFEIQNSERILRKKKYLQKCSQDSEIMNFVILKQKSILQKLIFFLKKFLISHILSALLSVLFIIIQTEYGKYCYMAPVCICNDDLTTKTYVSIKEYFSYWIIWILSLIQSVFIRDIYQNQTNYFKVMFFVIVTTFTFFWVIFSKEANYIPLIHYVVLLLANFFFQFWGLFRLKKSFKEKILIFMKLNQLPFIIFFNYLFFLFLYRKINESLIARFSETVAMNLVNLYISFYTLAFTYSLKKMLLNYSQYLIKLSHRNTQTIINLMRILLTLFVSIPTANLLKMDIRDWGGWFLIVSYINIMMGFYFKVDFMRFFFEKIKLCITHAKTESKINPLDEKNRIYVQKLLCGCVLDVQLICCFRLIILYVSNRWEGAFFEPKFYLNCEFEINRENFHINLWGVVILVVLNVLMAVFIFFYMIKKKNLIILYKIKHNFLYNVYLVYLSHVFFEAMINMFYLYIPS